MSLFRTARTVFVCFVVALATPSLAHAVDWLPVDPADLALAKPKIDPNADAEALLWDVRVTDQPDGDSFATIYQHYVRLKIFTERGRDAHSKIDLPYTSFARVRDVQGRTIAPNGTITELAGRDIFDRTIIEATGLKVKARTFALPAVVPGSIVEYQWREIHDDSLAQNVELAFQRDVPTHVVRYHIKPLQLRMAGYGMASQAFNIARVDAVQEREGYTMLQATNMPAFRSEPYTPAELSLKAWVLLYYRSTDHGDPPAEKFWSDYGRAEFNRFKPEWRVTGDIRQSAAQAVGSAQSVADKTAAIVRFVRSRVKRTDVDTTPEALAREKKVNKDVTATLKRGAGTGYDVTLLTAALASAAGLDAHLAFMADRSHVDPDPSLKQPYFYNHVGVAIRDGANWTFLDPSNEHAKGAHVKWQSEGEHALVLDDKAPLFVPVKGEPVDYSVKRRKGALKLLDNGTLEGTVTLEYTGHLAVQMRERDDDETETERKRLFSEEFAKRIPGFELGDYTAEHLLDPDEPYAIRFSFRAPGYAQRAGSRLLLQPAAIQHGVEAVFASSDRRHDIDLRFAWSEDDQVTIELPAGYSVEGSQPPGGVVIGDGKAAKYEVEVSTTASTLSYSRRFLIGGTGDVLFGKDNYSIFKRLFDAVQTGDAYVVTLRRAGQ